MNKREFNKLINQIRTKDKKRIDVDKIYDLSDTERSEMVYFIVRHRGPILKNLIPQGFDWKWLNCMGYFEKTEGKEYTFIHTTEQKWMIK